MKLIIYSQSEKGFWSNEHGWVSRADEATQFTPAEAGEVTMPVTKNKDAVWIKYHDRYILDDHGDIFQELNDKEAVDEAHEGYHKDGEIEIDKTSDPKVLNESTSRGDEMGCYVKAWVWVAWPEIFVDDVKVDVSAKEETPQITTSAMDAVAKLEQAMKACFWAGVDPADSMQEMYKRVEADVVAEMKSEDGREDDPLP